MNYQALYRKYRPQDFSEILGQPHVVDALKNAVGQDRIGHAYLFSGPRGTGKTSSARILAKALNCENPKDGEPCGKCGSCEDFQKGVSTDIHELDAASNNGVEAIRDLISTVALASGGKYKIYVLDEAHMLSAGAENALLKTLEEPPPYVVFVLCTTEPHKVAPTIRSRTQHLQFNLVPAEKLQEHVRFVAADSGLEVSDEDIEYVLKEGDGSVRDVLSALDQVSAAGGAPAGQSRAGDIVDAIVMQDTAQALLALHEALAEGQEPRVVGVDMVDLMRHAFLSAVGADLKDLLPEDAETARHRAEKAGAPVLTRSIEVMGGCLADMRSSPDPRIDLEVALVRICNVKSGSDVQSLAARVEALERAQASGQTGAVKNPEPKTAQPKEAPAAQPPAPAAQPPAPAAQPPAPAAQPPAPAAQPPALASAENPTEQPSKKSTYGAVHKTPKEPATDPEPEPEPSPTSTNGTQAEAPPPASATSTPEAPPAAQNEAILLPARESATLALSDYILQELPLPAKMVFQKGRFLTSSQSALRLGMANEKEVAEAQQHLKKLRDSLENYFSMPVPVEIVLDDNSATSPVALKDPDPETLELFNQVFAES